MIERFGGSEGTLYQRTLDFAVDRASSSMDLLEEAAVLLAIIAQEHPFLDGNKRTAFAASEVVLRVNGLRLSVSDQEAFEFDVSVARGEVGRKEVLRWLDQRVSKRRPPRRAEPAKRKPTLSEDAEKEMAIEETLQEHKVLYQKLAKS